MTNARTIPKDIETSLFNILPFQIGNIITDKKTNIEYKIIGIRCGRIFTEDSKSSQYHNSNTWYIECESLTKSVGISIPLNKLDKNFLLK